jgi:aminoglycoside phosphotransferase (APT) family kinase protein
MTPAAGAQMDVSVSLLRLFSRRLPFSVPTPTGFAALDEGVRAVVYPFIAGRPLDFAHLPGGPGIAAELGRALAALHNLDLALCEEAGLTSYDPDTYRTRRLADLDRAAATGLVPAGLLSRWERCLEDVSLWRFAPTAIHGDLIGSEVLAVFNDDDAATGHIRGLTGWENAMVADPADDFATLVTQAPAAAFDSVLEAYAHARLERPDKYLERRARLAGELKTLSELLTAVGSGNKGAIAVCTEKLRKLDAASIDELDAEPVEPTPPATREAPVNTTFTARANPDHDGTDQATTTGAPVVASRAAGADELDEGEPDDQDGHAEVTVIIAVEDQEATSRQDRDDG